MRGNVTVMTAVRFTDRGLLWISDHSLTSLSIAMER
jgi:hypothetical protein